MQFRVLQETPENSGNYIETGEVLDTDPETAAHAVADMAANGGRFGMVVYDPVARRVAPAPTPAPVSEEDQA